MHGLKLAMDRHKCIYDENCGTRPCVEDWEGVEAVLCELPQNAGDLKGLVKIWIGKICITNPWWHPK